MRCSESCKIKHQDIEFKTRRIQTMETTEQNNGEIGKELDKTNLEDLLDVIVRECGQTWTKVRVKYYNY